jgi:hypothetical protein
MSFNHAKVKALREESIRRGELGSPAPLSPAVLGVSGGEGVGGSVGGFGDVLMPGGGAASVVGSVEDSVEDVFSEFEVGVKTEKGAVELIFPLYDQYASDPRRRAVESFQDSSESLNSSYQSVCCSVESAKTFDSLSLYMNIFMLKDHSVEILRTVCYIRHIYQI